MHKLKDKIKLLLLFFSGEDKDIIELCNDDKIKWSFRKIGLLVACIFIGCFISATAFVLHIIERNTWVSFFIGISIGLVWAFIVANLYILLLYTISPAILPSRKEGRRKNKIVIENTAMSSGTKGINNSLVLRIIFMLILAIIIAQPLNVLFCSSLVKSSLNTFETEYKINMIVSADSSLIKEEVKQKKTMTLFIRNTLDSSIYAQIENKINEDEFFLIKSKALLDSLKKYDNFSLAAKAKHSKYAVFSNQLKALINSEINSDQSFLSVVDSMNTTNVILNSCVTRTKENIKSKINNYNTLSTLLERTDFYVETIKILLSENPVSWLLTILVCTMFIVPIRLKYRVRNTTNFYEEKKKLEQNFVKTRYEEFKKEFERIFIEKYKQYNNRLTDILDPFLAKLKSRNPVKHKLIQDERDGLINDSIENPITFYEHWADPPFNTIPKNRFNNLNNESDFINKIYS